MPNICEHTIYRKQQTNERRQGIPKDKKKMVST